MDKKNMESVARALAQTGQIDAEDYEAVARALDQASRSKTVSEAFSLTRKINVTPDEDPRHGDFQPPKLPVWDGPSQSSFVESVKYLPGKKSLKKVRTMYGYLRLIDYNDGSKTYEIFRTGPCRPHNFKTDDFEGAFVIGARK